MAKKTEQLTNDDENLEFTAPPEMEVREFTSGIRLKMQKKTDTETRYELPCGVEVIKKRGSGNDMKNIIRQAAGKQERISSLLIFNLIDFIDENGNRVKMHVEDIESLDLEDYLALQEIVNPEKKARLVPGSILSTS